MKYDPRIYRSIRWMASLSYLLFPISYFLFPGCVREKDRSGLLRGVEIQEARMEPEHTGYPDMLIDLPKGMVVEWTQEARFDKFFIYNPVDTGEVQRAMLIIDITPTPPKQIPDTASYQRSRGRMGEHSVQWREREVEEEPGSRIYQREMTSKEIFAQMEKIGAQGMVLHAFVVGSDHDLVEMLTASVETIRIIPSKPNL